MMKRTPELMPLSRDHHRALVLAKNAGTPYVISTEEVWSERHSGQTPLNMHHKYAPYNSAIIYQQKLL